MDSDRDGRVAVHEVQSMLERLGICLREDVVDELVREASHSGSDCRFPPSFVARTFGMRRRGIPCATRNSSRLNELWTNFKRPDRFIFKASQRDGMTRFLAFCQFHREIQTNVESRDRFTCHVFAVCNCKIVRAK